MKAVFFSPLPVLGMRPSLLSLQSVTEVASPLVSQNLPCWLPALNAGSYPGHRLL